jgi:hypothetical protein
MYEMEGLLLAPSLPLWSITRPPRVCGANHQFGGPTANLWPLGVRAAEGRLRTELPLLVTWNDV